MSDAGWMVDHRRRRRHHEGGPRRRAAGRQRSAWRSACRSRPPPTRVIAGDSEAHHLPLLLHPQADVPEPRPTPSRLFAGGYGTQDELFESLVLIQTGKSNIIPIVLMEGAGGTYWSSWDGYVRKDLGDNGWISPEDTAFYSICTNTDDAVDTVNRFYRVYQSSRYVGEDLVIRLQHRLRDEQLARLNDEYAILVKSGAMAQRDALPEENDHLELPRLVFHHRRHKYGELRKMIDHINSFAV
jgi:hypothetical protein